MSLSSVVKQRHIEELPLYRTHAFFRLVRCGLLDRSAFRELRRWEARTLLPAIYGGLGALLLPLSRQRLSSKSEEVSFKVLSMLRERQRHVAVEHMRAKTRPSEIDDLSEDDKGTAQSTFMETTIELSGEGEWLNSVPLEAYTEFLDCLARGENAQNLDRALALVVVLAAPSRVLLDAAKAMQEDGSRFSPAHPFRNWVEQLQNANHPISTLAGSLEELVDDVASIRKEFHDCNFDSYAKLYATSRRLFLEAMTCFARQDSVISPETAEQRFFVQNMYDVQPGIEKDASDKASFHSDEEDVDAARSEDKGARKPVYPQIVIVGSVKALSAAAQSLARVRALAVPVNTEAGAEFGPQLQTQLLGHTDVRVTKLTADGHLLGPAHETIDNFWNQIETHEKRCEEICNEVEEDNNEALNGLRCRQVLTVCDLGKFEPSEGAIAISSNDEVPGSEIDNTLRVLKTRLLPRLTLLTLSMAELGWCLGRHTKETGNDPDFASLELLRECLGLNALFLAGSETTSSFNETKFQVTNRLYIVVSAASGRNNELARTLLTLRTKSASPDDLREALGLEARYVSSRSSQTVSVDGCGLLKLGQKSGSMFVLRMELTHERHSNTSKGLSIALGTYISGLMAKLIAEKATEVSGEFTFSCCRDMPRIVIEGLLNLLDRMKECERWKTVGQTEENRGSLIY